MTEGVDGPADCSSNCKRKFSLEILHTLYIRHFCVSFLRIIFYILWNSTHVWVNEQIHKYLIHMDFKLKSKQAVTVTLILFDWLEIK